MEEAIQAGNRSTGRPGELSVNLQPQPANRNPQSELFFPFAPQPDIVRASQKDEYYKKLLYDKYFDLVRYYLGPREALTVQDETKLASDLSYYGLTTLVGRQTLGEEYCDLMQIQASRMTAPIVFERLLLLFWQVIIPYSINKAAHQLTKATRQPTGHTVQARWRFLTEERRRTLARWLPRVKDLVDIMQRIHLALFYFSGFFYSVSKRLTNVRYILEHKLDERRPRYHILGGLIIIQLAVSMLIFLKEHLALRRELQQLKSGAGDDARIDSDESNPAAEGEWGPSTGPCSLCLSTRKNPTATACGHLFCWTCITEWCNNKLECPLCRTPQKKTDLVVVYNI
eukprot:TRINITY_DN5837_c0_g2_i1.p1 TRINITY_DN5837_c0_g2~~TRINITY_DN5837_c0_g2_i1.p1  ORF type:complete len:355 (-),score=39.81 TRINITY_DN5837_c0_g2_i1:147-1172(-)